MTEAQKYEGALHKEKPGRKQQNQNQNQSQNQNQNQKKPNQGQNQEQNAKANGTTTHHRAPYVEDVPDVDDTKGKMHPPYAATPANNGNHVNVFDFLDTNASKVSVAEPQQGSVQGGPPAAPTPHVKPYDMSSYEQNGFSYGAGPVQPGQFPHAANVSTEFMTPAPKKKKDRSSRKDRGQASVATSEKKRKRRTEDVDMDDMDSPAVDTPMMDAPSSVQNHPGTPMLRHSGLTDGLDRVMRSSSVEGEEQAGEHRRRYREPLSPIRRTSRIEKDTTSFEAGLRGRAGRFVSSMLGGSVMSASSNHSSDIQPKALVRTRRRSSSDDGNGTIINHSEQPRRSKKSHKVRNPSNHQMMIPLDEQQHKSKRKTSGHSTHTDRSDRSSRRIKDSHGHDLERPHVGDDARDMVVFRQPNIPSEQQHEMALNFLSLVTKGPESSRGFSVNKILKRFHKDCWGEYEDGSSRADREQRQEAEKELWRTLRLKRNERGEIVVIL